MADESVSRRVESGTAPGGSERLSVFSLLWQFHDRARELLDRLELSAPEEVATRKALFRQLEQDLLVHMDAEERFLYSALEQREATRLKVLESFEEHLAVKTMLGTFTSLAVDDERWGPKLKVLSGILRQHLDQEEAELFPLAREVLGSERITEIMASVLQVKNEAEQAIQERAVRNTRGGAGTDAR